MPENITSCLSDVAIVPGQNDDSRVLLMDGCLGFLIELQRQ